MIVKTKQVDVTIDLFVRTASPVFDQYCVSSGIRSFREGVRSILMGDHLIMSSHGRDGVEVKVFRYDDEYDEVILVEKFDSTSAAVKWVEKLCVRR